MNKKEYAQQIVNELLTLTKGEIIEVADFVHFLIEKTKNKGIPLHQAGLTQEEALDLRRRLTTFESDWNVPGMEAYDNL
jgi:hypothetical protein